MHILLPPSEGKRPGGRGKPLSTRPASALLAAPRAEVAQALARLLADGDRTRIAESLALPESAVEASIAANRAFRSAPTMPALDRYAGVVYDGLAAQRLSEAGRSVAKKAVLVFSGLFGVVRGGEAIPMYRVPAKAVLPGIGVAGTFWRRHLAAAMAEIARRGVLIDLRSSDYSAMWQPARAGNQRAAVHTIGVRILSPRPDGSFGVISYPSKFHKGRLAARLIERAAGGAAVSSAEDVLAAWAELGELDGSVGEARGRVEVELRTRSATVVGGSDSAAY